MTTAGLALVKRLLDSGLTMWETGGRGKQITLHSASDKIREFMQLFAAEQERGKGSERSRRVKAQAAKAGRDRGKRLYGYTPGFEIIEPEAIIVDPLRRHRVLSGRLPTGAREHPDSDRAARLERLSGRIGLP